MDVGFDASWQATLLSTCGGCVGKDAVELEVTLDGEGKDRVFRVSIKWHAQVHRVARGYCIFIP
jgi:hypothetical protein